MKRFIILLSLLFCNVVFADTINLHWLNYDGTSYQNSTCVVDSDLILPSTPPTRYGYTFTGWKIGNYIPIEYLESTGTQYIDTGYKPNQNTSIMMDFMIISQNNDSAGWIFGGRNGFSQTSFSVLYDGSNMFAFDYNSRTQIAPLTPQFYNNEIILNINKNQITAYKKETNNSITPLLTANSEYKNFYVNYNLYLYSGNTANNTVNAFNGILKFYYFKIYDNNYLIRDFIPVLDGSGTPCMFDRVESKFYYNQGTGQFIAGPSL